MDNYEKGFYYTLTGGDSYGWRVSIMGRRIKTVFPTMQEARTRVRLGYLVYLREKGIA